MAKRSQYRFKQNGRRNNWPIIAFLVLIALVALVQYRLWFGNRGVPSYIKLKQQAVEQENRNKEQADRNARLKSDIYDLQTGEDAVEERARSDMGMIKEGEVFIYFGDKDDD